MATALSMLPITGGGAFLIENRAPAEIFTVEDLSEEHLAIARTVDEFWAKEVEPNLEAIQHHEPGLARGIVRKSADLGLTAIMIPEKFGGMELDITAMMVAAEHFAGDASWSGWQSAHVGIGTLPLLLFGNEQQKSKYLPKLANLDMLSAYALTEPHAGSDALAARTRADLSPDGTHYILNGQKMWITNGGAADLFTVFAKVDGEKFTAFLVERDFGVKSGAEEKKMGIKGSSTTALYFDNVPVPVENVLGEIGRGHIIAFNILNLGRLKLGPGAMGSAKKVLATSIKYAKERKAFGSRDRANSARFSRSWRRWRSASTPPNRSCGAPSDWSRAACTASPGTSPTPPRPCSKRWRSSRPSAPSSRCTRRDAGLCGGRRRPDPRRLRIPSGLLGRALVSRFAHQPHLRRDQRDQPPADSRNAAEARRTRAARASRRRQLRTEGRRNGRAAVDEENRLVENAKKIALLIIAAAQRKYPDRPREAAGSPDAHRGHDHRDVRHGVRAVAIAQTGAQGKTTLAADMTAVLLRDAMARIEISSRNALAATADRDAQRQARNLAAYEPVNTIDARRRIAQRLLQAERYVV